VISTVRDDREDVEELLAALARQTRPPDELVIVDGGSSDGTLELLESWSRERLPLRVLSAPNTNISAGRNVAIEAASHEWIACTDAGCRPIPTWLEAIDRARPRADLLTGVFTVDCDTAFERMIAVTHYPDPAELEQPGALVRVSHRLFGRAFEAKLAGGRSMAFTKTTWRAVGGFPEGVYAGEDQAFSVALVERGYGAVLVPEASVAWRPPSTWAENARMFFTYCRGDVRSGDRSRHVARTLAWTAAPLLIRRGGTLSRMAVLLGGAGYLGLPIQRALRSGAPPSEWWRIPPLIALKDLSQMAGAAAGLIDAALERPQPNPHDISGAPSSAAEIC
jgi:cellulose synthase/poly-beta-1,6-N-acetylglucosamine synthase-like glycosyltransferase